MAAIAGSFAALYVLACWFGESVAGHTQGTTALWPGSGVLLAGLLLATPRTWPGWILGAGVIHAGILVLLGEPVLGSIALALARALESTIAAAVVLGLLRRRPRLETTSEFLALLCGAALAANAASALVGAGVLSWIRQTPFLLGWSAWFLSAAASMLVVAPPLVHLGRVEWADLQFWTWRRLIEVAITFAALAVASSLVLGAPFGDSWVQRALLRPIVCYPLLLWAAFRFGPRATTAGFLLVASISAAHTLRGEGVFAVSKPLTLDQLLTFDAYLAFASILVSFPSLIIAAGQRAEAALAESEKKLRASLCDSQLAEAARQVSENRYRTISEITANVAYSYKLDESGRTHREWVAGDYVGVLGYTPDEIDVLNGWLSILHPADVSQALSLIPQLSRGESVVAESRIIRKDGQLRWLRHFTRPVLEPNTGRLIGVYGALQDITEQRRAEELLREREAELTHMARLSTLGELVAGISHELAQPLSAIANYAAACATSLEAGSTPAAERSLEWVRQISLQASRAGSILARLRNFARKNAPDRVSVDLNQLLEETVELLAFESRRAGVPIDLALAENLPPAPADRIQIQQVAINLLRNSFDSLQDVPSGERRVTISTRERAGHVEFQVSDTGPGVPTEVQDKLFTPFFTTKSHGLGMGLPISRTIVDSHGGRIWAEPTPEGGATFCVALPLAVREDSE